MSPSLTVPWLRTRASPAATVRFLERSRFTGLPTDWSAVVGHEHARRELEVVAAALNRRDFAERLGVPLVKGILITGPSGSGKTLLARAFAGMVERPVFVLSAADLTVSRIRRLYEALTDTPSVVVIDEIDVIASRSWGSAPRSRTVGALCVALDGVKALTGPITIGLTAEDADDLDRSIVRSGRLTTKVVLELPTADDRRRLWERSLADIPIAGELDLVSATDRSQGMTGADIAATALAAAGLALADGRETLDQAHLDEALERRGVVRRSPTRDARTRRSVAIHEAGHAVFAFAAFGADALAEVAIRRLERGVGHTVLRTEWAEEADVDGRHWQLQAQLSLAGILAEELVDGRDGMTFGSSTDIVSATRVVLRAAESGLIEAFGIASTTQLEAGMRGSSWTSHGSESMRAELWRIVRTELDRLRDLTRDALAPERSAIEVVADRLLTAGVLSGDALIAVLREAGATEGSRV